jgi:hypothetical protein
MMAADVKESSQDAIASSHDQDRLFGHIPGDELTWFTNLIDAPYHLPRAGKNRPGLQPKDPRVHIPWGRNRPRLGEA